MAYNDLTEWPRAYWQFPVTLFEENGRLPYTVSTVPIRVAWIHWAGDNSGAYTITFDSTEVINFTREEYLTVNHTSTVNHPHGFMELEVLWPNLRITKSRHTEMPFTMAFYTDDSDGERRVGVEGV